MEGLAGSFEPRVATERFGPNRRENGRTRDFRRHLAEGRVPSISSLLEAATTPADDLDRESFYDGAAVLCSWLVRNDPEGMADYIRTQKWNRSVNREDGRAAFEAYLARSRRLNGDGLTRNEPLPVFRGSKSSRARP